MLIIFGTKTKLTLVNPSDVLQGACATCHGDLTLKENKTFFTLFFMPIFSIGSKGKFYHCDRCNAAYKAEAREYLIRPMGA